MDTACLIGNNILSSDIGDFILWLELFLFHSEIVSHDTESPKYGNLMFDCFMPSACFRSFACFAIFLFVSLLV